MKLLDGGATRVWRANGEGDDLRPDPTASVRKEVVDPPRVVQGAENSVFLVFARTPAN